MSSLIDRKPESRCILKENFRHSSPYASLMKMIKTVILLAALLASAPLSPAQLWQEAEGRTAGWKYLDWFGWFWSVGRDEGWIYTRKLGWLYAEGENTDDFYLYAPDLHWLRTSEKFYPEILSVALQQRYVLDTEAIGAYPFAWKNLSSGVYETREQVAYRIADPSAITEEYQIVRAIYLVRHGQRFPTSNAPAVSIVPTNPKWLVEYDDDGATKYDEETGLMGVLTPVGVFQGQTVGNMLRSKLMEKTSLLSADFAPEQLEIVSDVTPRCQQTASGVLFGLYPGLDADTAASLIAVDDAVFSLYESGSAPSPMVPQEIQQAFDANQQAWSDHYGADLDLNDLYSVADFLQFYWFSGLPFPNGFTKEDFSEIAKLRDQYLASLYTDQAAAYQQSETVLAALANACEGNALDGQPSSASLFLFAGHDGDIIPVMGAFGQPLEQAPVFVSFLEILVLEKEGQEFVRVSFEGEELDLSAIYGESNSYDLATFLDYLKNGP